MWLTDLDPPRERMWGRVDTGHPRKRANRVPESRVLMDVLLILFCLSYVPFPLLFFTFLPTWFLGYRIGTSVYSWVIPADPYDDPCWIETLLKLVFFRSWVLWEFWKNKINAVEQCINKTKLRNVPSFNER